MTCPIDCIPWQERLDDAIIFIDSLDCISNYPQEIIDQAYKYWAAHLVFITNPTAYAEKIKFGVSERSFKLPELGTGYMASPYGQYVNELLGGCLASKGLRTAQVFFTGSSCA